MTAPAAIADAYATPFLRQLAGRTWVERVATPERTGRLDSVDERSPILSRHAEDASADPHAGFCEAQLEAAAAGFGGPSLRPRRAASWSAGDLPMTFNPNQRRWEGGPAVDLSGFGPETVNPRRTSLSADDAKENSVNIEELAETLAEAETRRDGELRRFLGGAAVAKLARGNDAAAWLRRGDAARALGALPEEPEVPVPARNAAPSPARRGAGESAAFAPAPASARRNRSGAGASPAKAAAPAPARRGRTAPAPTPAPARARTRGAAPAPAPPKARSSAQSRGKTPGT